jgi:hypothetical protein
LICRAEIKNLYSIGDGKYFYNVEYVEHDREKRTLNFDVIHNREEGATGLLFLVYEKINKILNAKN